VKPYTVDLEVHGEKRAILGRSHTCGRRPTSAGGAQPGICGGEEEPHRQRVKANHLSYLGTPPSEEGHVGAGTITCTTTGIHNTPTVLGDGVFVGSDTMLVRAGTVGKGALIGRGRRINEKTSPVRRWPLCRAEEKVIEGWVARKRPELLKKSGAHRPRGEEGKKDMCGIVGLYRSQLLRGDPGGRPAEAEYPRVRFGGGGRGPRTGGGSPSASPKGKISRLTERIAEGAVSGTCGVGTRGGPPRTPLRRERAPAPGGPRRRDPQRDRGEPPDAQAEDDREGPDPSARRRTPR